MDSFFIDLLISERRNKKIFIRKDEFAFPEIKCSRLKVFLHISVVETVAVKCYLMVLCVCVKINR